MATKAKEEVKLEQGKKSFVLLGEAKLSDNAFPPEGESASNFISKRFNLGVKVKDERVSYAEMFGGFFGNNPRDLKPFVTGKDGGKGSRMEVAWEDRLDLGEEVLNTIANFDVITIALEKDANGKLFYKRFLSAYDAIPYIEEHLKDGDKIKVKGNLSPNYYNGTSTLRKEITSIYLVEDKPNEQPTPPVAIGKLTILVDENSIGKTRVKQDDELDINGSVVAYASKINGREVKKQIPFPVSLILPLHTGVEDKAVRGKINRLLEQFTVKKGSVNEVTLLVEFEEGTVVNEATLDDLDKDSRQLVEEGIISLEDAIGKVSVSGGRVNRVVITAPEVKREVDAKGKPQIRVEWEKDKYKAEDILFDFDGDEPVEDKADVEEDLEKDANEMFANSGGDDEMAQLLAGLGIS